MHESANAHPVPAGHSMRSQEHCARTGGTTEGVCDDANNRKTDLGGKTLELPVRSGTIGPDVIDIRSLYATTRHVHLRSGLHLDRGCESAITYIDGDKGVLLYRGYPIDQLAEKGDFLEVCYLLLYGELPTDGADGRFRQPRHAPHDGARADALLLPRLPPRRAPDGDHVRRRRRAVAPSTTTRPTSPIRTQRKVASIRMIAKMPTIAAMAYKYSLGQPFVYPRNELDYAANFLHMCFAVPGEDYEVNPVLARAMDRIFILHADHEQNASTSTVRLAGSSGANPFACIAAGIACLWGPAHGGANEAALEHAGGDRHGRPHSRIHRARQGQERSVPPDGLRPPRLQELRSARQGHAEDRARGAGRARASTTTRCCRSPWNWRRSRWTDEYFIEKKLYPNVDFYSGIILKAMGFPTSMFTVLFALSRAPSAGSRSGRK